MEIVHVHVHDNVHDHVSVSVSVDEGFERRGAEAQREEREAR